uniref:Oxidored_FMN domain-containing protein n=2 Tax=Caenorhabditis tropicalis TaxID=1561998 RepID=A0A1I7V4L4_9PELO
MILTSNVLVDLRNLEAAGNAIIFKEGDSLERRALFSHWAKLMKQDGALAVIQLSHAGRQTPEHVNPTPWSASDVQLVSSARFTTYGKPKALSTEQVRTEVIDRFVYGAKYAYECGFDGVQLHGAHGYLLSQFTSPTTNKRNDKYGGSIENRQRIILEIYDAIRAEIPASTGFLVGIKTNSVEFQAEGTTLEDAKEMCQTYENVGFDFVELSGGTYEKLLFNYERESSKKREAFFVEFAEQIRPVFIKTVVYLTGGFRTTSAMVDAILKNATQGIGLGRPITAEPDLPKKILEGSAMSAVQDCFNQNDMSTTAMASGTQMEQMGRTNMKKAGGDLLHQITDFSNKEAADRFSKALVEHLRQAERDITEGKIPKPIVVFD